MDPLFFNMNGKDRDHEKLSHTTANVNTEQYGIEQIKKRVKTGILEGTVFDNMPIKKIGELLVENHVITKENFEKALRKQNELKILGKGIPFLQLLVELDYIEPRRFLKIAKENQIRIPLGEILVMEGVITSNQLSKALLVQSGDQSKKLGEILIKDMKIISEDVFLNTLAKQFGNLRIRPDLTYFDQKLFFAFKKQHLIAGKFVAYNSYEDGDHKVIQILVSDPSRNDLDDLRDNVLNIALSLYGLPVNLLKIEYCFSTNKEIIEFINSAHSEKDHILIRKKNIEDYLIGGGSDTPVFNIGKEYSSEKEIINVFSSILKRGLDYGASDIHIEPVENKLRIRYRIDGVLKWDSDLPIQMKEVLMRGLKYVLGFSDAHKLDKTFDERFKVHYVDKKLHVDLRISILPLLNGDKMVMRILIQNTEVPTFTDLGMKKNTRIKYVKVCGMSSGIIIVTGPTGSGKTTTLYSTINKLQNDSVNIVTIEDPPEYLSTGVNHVKVKGSSEKNGISYLDALKSTLRQDPDIIMFGEMRDNESASVAMSAGMTGHLLFTTLHTNDAVSSITRLADLGIRPFMLSSTLVSILAQRLIRKTCNHCKEVYEPTEDDLEFFKVTIDQLEEQIAQKKIIFTRGKGCEKCRFTGFKGRIGIFELLCVNEELKKAVLNNATAKEIEDMAREFGMVSMVEDGFLKAIDGQTTVEEIIRVSRTLQAPKKKRSVDEIRYLLEGDLSRQELTASIYSGVIPGESKDIESKGITPELKHSINEDSFLRGTVEKLRGEVIDGINNSLSGLNDLSSLESLLKLKAYIEQI